MKPLINQWTELDGSEPCLTFWCALGILLVFRGASEGGYKRSTEQRVVGLVIWAVGIDGKPCVGVAIPLRMGVDRN